MNYQTFDEFLKDQGTSLNDFTSNLANDFYSPDTFLELIERETKQDHLNCIISSAFSWKDTPEGFDFWGEVDNLWAKYLVFFKAEIYRDHHKFFFSGYVFKIMPFEKLKNKLDPQKEFNEGLL